MKYGYLIYSLVILLSINLHLSAQDISGLWEGHYTYAGSKYPFELNINQNQKVISGFAVSYQSKDSSVYHVSGTLVENVLELTATSFIHKSGLACLPKFKVTLDKGQLEGKWGPNAVWGGCLIGVRGKLSLTKTEPTNQTVATIPEKQETPIVVNDFEGSELIAELKSRKYYALIVGINNYGDPNIPTLSKPITDAKLLSQTLQNEYTFEKEHVILLENPTRANLIETFDDLSQRITNRDNLLIFYAGHGIWDERLKQGFWLPSDATKASKAQWLSNGTIRDYIRAIDSKHTLLITDACFGGSILKERAVFFNGKAMLEMYKRPSRKAMTSGALSTVPDESVFIKYLVKNLTQNTAPLVSAEQIFGNFKVAVINNSETGQVPQYGAITLAGDEGGDFIFLKRQD